MAWLLHVHLHIVTFCLPLNTQHYSKTGRQLIGSLNAASNITGVLTDTVSFSSLLHKYGAFSFWDYATAAPYIGMDMNPKSK